MRLRLSIAFIHAILASTFMLAVCLLLLVFMREQRIKDHESHSLHVARQIAAYAPMQRFVEDHPDAPSISDMEAYLTILLDGDPFLEELSIFDPFSKMRLRVAQRYMETDGGQIRRAAPSLQELFTSGKPTLAEETGEYFVPLFRQGNMSWGVLRVRWSQDSIDGALGGLRSFAFYASTLLFAITFFISYIMLRQTYSVQHQHLSSSLRTLSGKNFSQRIETNSLSTEIAHIGVYINRILREVEEEKKKAAILDDTLRQVERSYTQTRKSLEERLAEIHSLRQELREGLRLLFDTIWCGVAVIDSDYRIHSINEAAQRLLRFAKIERDSLLDDRLRQCLQPLVREEEVERIDDLCVWPQSNLGRSVTCRIRAARIPTGDDSTLYFLVLREESGFPSAAGAAYFSERLVLDLLNREVGMQSVESFDEEVDSPASIEMSQRFRACLNRISWFHQVEQGRLGPITSIRLTRWLRDRFTPEDLFSEYLRIEMRENDEDINLCVPENAFSEFLDCVLLLMQRNSDNGEGKTNPLLLRVSREPNGKPILSISVMGVKRKQAVSIQTAMDDRHEPVDLDIATPPANLEALERDICVSLYFHLKRALKAQIECIYSAEKRLATIRMTFEHSFAPANRIKQNTETETVDPVRNLMQNFLAS